jgi:hypothetical protein
LNFGLGKRAKVCLNINIIPVRIFDLPVQNRTSGIFFQTVEHKSGWIFYFNPFKIIFKNNTSEILFADLTILPAPAHAAWQTNNFFNPF